MISVLMFLGLYLTTRCLHEQKYYVINHWLSLFPDLCTAANGPIMFKGPATTSKNGENNENFDKLDVR